jgi:hypothetical protein
MVNLQIWVLLDVGELIFKKMENHRKTIGK